MMKKAKEVETMRDEQFFDVVDFNDPSEDLKEK